MFRPPPAARRPPPAARRPPPAARGRDIFCIMPVSPTPTASIDLRIRSLGQLFESMDPSPFREKALDDRAARYLVESVREHPREHHLRVVIELPESLRIAAHHLPDAIHNHFRLELEQARRELHWRMGAGWRALALGLLLLTVCIPKFDTSRPKMGLERAH